MCAKKTFQKGGQRRTLQANCGFKCVGHPNEVNKKWLQHKRYCIECRENQTEELPEFNKEAGLINGWNGLVGNYLKPNQMMTMAITNGKKYDILSNTKSVDESIEEIRFLIDLLEKQK